jgi:hypothetical protein
MSAYMSALRPRDLAVTVTRLDIAALEAAFDAN